nr:PREDICTED: uncharacterized protein LOC109648014 [Paralichthys olivaceus]
MVVKRAESECRRKWKTLRDQHRRERQREKERRESGIGLFNYRPWRYSSILSFLNPFIDARAAGTNGWALDPQASHLHAVDMVGCITTMETRSDDDETYGFAVADATSSSSSLSECVQRKRPSPANGDAVRLKQAKIEPFDQPAPPAVLQPDLHRQVHGSPSTSRLNHQKPAEQDVEILDHSDDDEEEEFSMSPRPTRARGRSGGYGDGLLVEYLRRMESREVPRNLNVDQRDDVTFFLLSLAPALRRLSAEKQSLVRTKFQQLLHEAEFGTTNFQ